MTARLSCARASPAASANVRTQQPAKLAPVYLRDLNTSDGVTPWISFQPVPDGRNSPGGITIARAFDGEGDLAYYDAGGAGTLSAGYGGAWQRGQGELSGAAAAGTMLLEASAQTEALGIGYARMDVSVRVRKLARGGRPGDHGRYSRRHDHLHGLPRRLGSIDGGRLSAGLQRGPAGGTRVRKRQRVVASGYISAYAWAWTTALGTVPPPVPEPAMLAMLFPGLLLVGGALRRRPLRKCAAPTPAPRG